MDYFSAGLDRIVEGQGVATSIAGMTIVFTALAAVSVFIALLPKVLNLLSHIMPDSDTKTATDDDNIAVAIGVALHHEIFESDNNEDN
jgi:hypothetical protein